MDPSTPGESHAERHRALLHARVTAAGLLGELVAVIEASRTAGELVERLGREPFSFPMPVAAEVIQLPLAAWVTDSVGNARQELHVLERQLTRPERADERHRWERSLPSAASSGPERRSWLAEGVGEGWADVACVVGAEPPRLTDVVIVEPSYAIAVVEQRPGLAEAGIIRVASVVSPVGDGTTPTRRAGLALASSEQRRRSSVGVDSTVVAALFAPRAEHETRNELVRRYWNELSLRRSNPTIVVMDGAEHGAYSWLVEGWRIVHCLLSLRASFTIAAEQPLPAPVHLMRLVDPADVVY